MGDVLSFKKDKKSRSRLVKSAKKKVKELRSTKKTTAGSKSEERSSEGEKTSSKILKTKKKKETLNAESIKLWWISQEFDELIRKAVIDKHIPVEELSAVMAHRLGTLLLLSEKTPELTLFCLKLISKITHQKTTGSNAS